MRGNKNIETTICKSCHNEFKWDTYGSPPRKFCSEPCRNRCSQHTYQQKMRKAYRESKSLLLTRDHITAWNIAPKEKT